MLYFLKTGSIPERFSGKKKKDSRKNWKKRSKSRFRICASSSSYLETNLYRSNDVSWVLVPHYKEIPEIIEKCHMGICCGINSTVLNITTSYYIPDKRKVVDEYKKRCPRCFRKHKIKKPIIPYKFTNNPTVGYEICMDQFETFMDVQGYSYVLVVVETTSLFVWTRPIRTKRAQEVSHSLNEIIMNESLRPVIRTDNGSEFQKEVIVWAEGKGLKIKRIQPRKSRSNVCSYKFKTKNCL